MIFGLLQKLEQALDGVKVVVEEMQRCAQDLPNMSHRQPLPGGALLQALNSAPVIMIEIVPDPPDDPEIIFAGHLIEELLGYAHGELQYKPLSIVVPDAKKVIHRINTRGYQQHPEDRLMGENRDVQAQKKNGECVDMMVILKRFFDEGRQFVIATGMFQESDAARATRSSDVQGNRS